MLSSLTLSHVVITLTTGHNELGDVYTRRSVVVVRVGVGFGGSDVAVPGSTMEGAANWAAKSIFF